MTMEQSLVAAVTAQRGELFSMLRRAPLPAARERAGEIMDLLGLTPRAGALSRNLSHGEQKLLDIGSGWGAGASDCAAQRPRYVTR